MFATALRKSSPPIGDSALARRLAREIEGEVLFDPFSRGRYSTDASIYQIEPIGVVVPKSNDDIAAVIAIAADEGVPVLPRGGGTSQCGQTVAAALVVDTSKYLNRVIEYHGAAGCVTVEPGLVLDALNGFLRPHGMFFPVDPSTASRATLGGMTANNSCGARSIRYGLMVDNVRAIDGVLADGTAHRFAHVPADLDGLAGEGRYGELVGRLRAIGAREEAEILRRFPKVLRRVGGYNIDTISAGGHNMAKLLVGSEGTLAFFTALELEIQPIPAHSVLGVCGFKAFADAMDITRHIVELDPAAVEVIDRTMIGLARSIAAYRPIVDRFVTGDPEALLMVEFAGEDLAEQTRRLKSLGDLLADHGFPDAVLEVTDRDFQRDIFEVRKAGLNIMMSMKGDGKPISFIEDCAVPLDDLAEYTTRLTDVFARHGVEGTWYAHASVGCLHVRPVLNMKDGGDVRKMRAIAEETFAMVREYKGSHSGEHGDGIVRSEFHTPMFGERIVAAFEDVKQSFDPTGLFNPGKIVDPPRMDDRDLFRYRPGYAAAPMETALDWSEWGGLIGAVEMCNNNGECRKAGNGVMCPSYRVTGDEQHVTRGRANSLRLAITGQLGPDALASDEMAEAMDLCISCKGCRRECPTGVDMARMKIEVLNRRRARFGLGLRDRLFAYLPRYGRWAAGLRGVVNLRDRVPGLAWLSEKTLGLSAGRPLPRWRRVFTDGAHQRSGDAGTGAAGDEVALFVDTFSNYFEPENAQAACDVLRAAGRRVRVVTAGGGGRPLCCGRTFLSAGMVDEAREEATRLAAALAPTIARGVPIVGLEPACVLTLRDEIPALLPGTPAAMLGEHVVLFEEFLAAEADAGRLALPLGSLPHRKALVHGHCHQKAFGIMADVVRVLRLVPELEVEVIESGCCGMAGSFGFEAEHYAHSMKMAELALLPAIRGAGTRALVVANGTSCRQQIAHGTGREALYVARVLQAALEKES
jgi:FAD/FMN-containing dehydrogenase/Fe-S oxidoreductase